ncbi:MAG TPA: Rieske 2Fe-2S domain-containing protein [Chloroflexia bacterium]|nr:Rieske 2Fe-2S domain-containing protein [Chloroflexia bacterium]
MSLREPQSRPGSQKAGPKLNGTEPGYPANGNGYNSADSSTTLFSTASSKNDLPDLDIPSKDPTYTRRQFLKWGIYGVAGAVTLAVGVPTALYFINPALQSADSGKILVDLGTPSQFANQTTPKAVLADYKYTDTFKPAEGSKQVFVRALKPNASTPADFEVLDSTCTHAGCTVSFVASLNKFKCPCHGSIYSVDGINEAVAPKPLHKYSVVLNNGKLAINVAEVTA